MPQADESPNQSLNDARAREIMDEFAFLDDWEERYRHVIELGKALEPMAAGEHCAANKVSGCVSQVWLAHELLKTPEPDGMPWLHFRADSDAHIVRGLAALLIRYYSDRPVDAIIALDAGALFDAIGLAGNLSAQRANGLLAMIGRIRATARAVLKAT